MSHDTTRRENPQHDTATAGSDVTSSNSSPHRSRINVESDDSEDSIWPPSKHRTRPSGRRNSDLPAVGQSVPREATPKQVEVKPILPQDTLSRPSRPHVEYAMPVMPRGPIQYDYRHIPEPPRGYHYEPQPGLSSTAYPSHRVNYPEPVTVRLSVPNLHPRPSNRPRRSPARGTSYSYRNTNQQDQQPQNSPQLHNASRYHNPPQYQTSPQLHNPSQYHNPPQYQNPQYGQPGPSYSYDNPFAQYQQPFQPPIWPYSHTDLPYVPPQSPYPPRDPPDTTVLDVDKIRVEAQLEVMRAIEHKTKLADEQKDFEARIRKQTEEDVLKRLEAIDREQEEATKKAEWIKIEAEKKAREELQAKQRAEIDRERLAAVQAKRLEDDLRTKIKREREIEEDMIETRARQREEFESRVMEKMLQRMEEVTDFAKRKMLHDLGMENEAVDKLVEKSISHGMEMHRVQTSATSVGKTQKTGEEPSAWQQSAGAHTTIKPRSQRQFNLHALRHQTVTREQLPGSPRVSQHSRRASPFESHMTDSATTTTTESKRESLQSEVPPHVPSPPGNLSYTGLETQSSGRTDSRHTSSGSTMSRDSYGTYDSYSEFDEEHSTSEFYPPPLRELADEIIQVLMHRLAGWPGPGIQTPQPSSHFGQPRRERSFSVYSESTSGGIPMAQSYSSESTRSLQTDSSDRRVSPPKPAIEEKPFQLRSSVEDGSCVSEAQMRMDSMTVVTLPDSETSHAAGTSDDSVADVKSLTEDVTKRNDDHASLNAEVDASLLENSSPAGGQMCTLM